MSLLLLAFFIILHVFSLLFCFIALYRLYSYIRRYRFTESAYTLLLGFVHLRWIAGLYVATAFLWVIFSYILITLK